MLYKSIFFRCYASLHIEALDALSIWASILDLNCLRLNVSPSTDEVPKAMFDALPQNLKDQVLNTTSVSTKSGLQGLKVDKLKGEDSVARAAPLVVDQNLAPPSTSGDKPSVKWFKG